MLGISYKDFEDFGCPNCGCDSAKGGSFVAYGEQIGTCRNCNLQFFLLPHGRRISETRIGTNRKDSNGKDILENVLMIPHPRKNINKWHYELPDNPPKYGEYWSPRGIGYDLSGFVKCKQAGERILAMVKEILGREGFETYLDYRESEPYWIQFKFSSKEFDLNKLYNDTKDTGIITREIIENAMLR